MNAVAQTLPAATMDAGNARDWFALLKPRVMSLVVFTGAVGLWLAPVQLHPVLAFTAVLCIAVGAGAAGAFNQWLEADLDAKMRRTRNRPLAAGRLPRHEALAFAWFLAVASVVVMGLALNPLAAALLAFAIWFYAVAYTQWLKPRTPQNIVIGGGAGAFPPLIGWVAATGDVSALPLILFGLVFLWTPPHFWALALFVRSDYAAAGVPMLPVTHGPAFTRRQIAFYSVVLVAVSLLPVALHLAGWVYAAAACVLGAMFLALALLVWRNPATEPAGMRPEKRLFAFSISYLFLLFVALVGDRALLG